MYFPQDGVVFFTPNSKRYGAIKPVPHSMIASGRDVVRELADQRELATNVWLVLLHNTRLGEAHPNATVANAFGDHYVYNLCPSAPDARAYAIGLARDVTKSYPVAGVSLGDARASCLTHTDTITSSRSIALTAGSIPSLASAFVSIARLGPKQAGIKIEALRRQVALDIEAYLASDVDYPADMAEAFWLADTRTDGELAAFLGLRCDIVTSLVREIRDSLCDQAQRSQSSPLSPVRPRGAWYEGSDLKALAEAAGIIEACFYEPGADADQGGHPRRQAPAARRRNAARHPAPRVS